MCVSLCAYLGPAEVEWCEEGHEVDVCIGVVAQAVLALHLL
jgi:hypothetical protein